jgi:hypothetical protein
MKMFSDCRGPCSACAAAGGGCPAVPGDGDFEAAPLEELVRRIRAGKTCDRCREYDIWEMKELKRWILAAMK